MSINFHSQAQALREELIVRRRDLHRHPEIAFEETRTAGIVAAALSEMGLEVQTGIGKTGVVGLLEGEGDGPTLLVRADMDALPVHEANETEYISEIPGKMHACGHDGHTSIGLAVAKMLSQYRAQIKGRVKFVFQPAEEIGEGALAMIADGVLENPRPDYSIGLHLWNELPVGMVGVTAGPSMAAADIWKCVLTGYGGHGAQPQKTHDPIVAAAQAVTALQAVVSRNVDPLDTAVISVCSIHAGEAFNVIPSEVEMKGTIRSFSEQTRAMLHARLHEVIEGVAGAMQCRAEIEIMPRTKAVNNAPDLAERVAAIAADIVGESNVKRGVRTMGAEDMSYLMDDIPGCYFFVGSSNKERGLDYPHHNPRFDIDEEALVIAATVLANVAASFVIPKG
jgi:amidohydrolase